MSKKALFVIVVIVLLLGAAGAFWYFNRSAPDGALTADASTPSASATTDSIGPDEHVLGSATAPVTIIEYFSQGCSVCAHFDQTVFPQLKAKYIDTGKVRYVMRLFPLFPIDGPAYKLDLCVPKENFFAAADLLFRNQPQWDSGEYPVADPHGGLIKMARILGLSPEQADACMNSTAHDAAINKVASDATARYNPSGTPTFIIDFKKADVPPGDWNAMQAAIDAALAAKHAIQSAGGQHEKKQSLLALAVILLLLLAGGAWYFTRPVPDADVTAAASNLPPDSIGPDEHVFGSANAPVTVVEYFAQVCPHCADFEIDVFPMIKAKYIDTGKVRYVMRPFPIRPLDGPAFKLDLCVPKEQWLSAVDLLFRNQKEWDAAEFPDVPDPHAGLIKMARILGLSAEQADACMNSTVHDAAVNKVEQDGLARYQIGFTPTFLIDFRKVDLPQNSWEEFQAAADAALAAKGAK